jgi:hypothetical protein
MRMTLANFAVAVAFCLALVFASAGGCDESKGTCHPGDTKAAHGHVEKCGPDKKWHL